MAYLAQLGAVTDELIAAIVPLTKTEQAKLNSYHESALRNLKYAHHFPRANQFEVEDHLNGLEERFRVVGRDALADAFKKRLDALEPHRNRWTPDILHFILELSDQPAQKSQLSDLDLLFQTEDAGPKLTWQEIAKEDGWYEEDRLLWRNTNYAPSSSDEDEYEDIRPGSSSAESTEGTASSSADEHQHRTAQDLIFVSNGATLLKQVEESQAWRHSDGEHRQRKTPISSIQLLREVLFMLGGLETTLFDLKCDPVADYQLAGVSWDTHKALVTSFAECGRNIAPLRKFITGKEPIPLLQVFQDAVQKALRTFDQNLVSIQGRFVAIKGDVVVSLMNILVELKPSLVPLYALSNIVRQLQEERNPHAFRYLELLYDAVGSAQLEGSDAAYRLLGGIFFDCFQVYLQPIRLWMEEGKLLPGDRTFFVSESPTKIPLHQIWNSQFNLLRTPEGTLHAPRFLQPAIHRIFTTGKSIVVLKYLKQHESVREQRQSGTEPQMDFGTICCSDSLEFAPFSELFSTAFDVWIQSKHHTASSTLRGLLFRSYGLSQSLDALQSVYLGCDGSLTDMFTSALFRHLDSLSGGWRDRFTLTEIVQDSFSARIDSHRLSAHLIESHKGLVHSAVASRSSVRVSLPAICLRYRLNWPVQLVIPDDAISQYQTIFTFLLQVRRATSILLKHPLKRSNPTGEGVGRYHLLRAKLLWFCNAILTYLTSLVLLPNTVRLREGLAGAVDVDDMIAVHSDFTSRIISDSLLETKLEPIKECVLDLFDLAIKLEDAQRAEMARQQEEEQEISRLSAVSSPARTPFRSPAKPKSSPQKTPRRRVDSSDEEDDQDEELEASMLKRRADKSYAQVLREIHTDFERHLRFVTGGLRGVARASRDEGAAGKWDLLAEMLEVGIRE
ncbi:Spc98 family-domain-containing protein [Diplogelasinospora grovesii]|uniref:Spindle pole body component n=1 Tax=Diplogelasinospora grovesii TaxID=303347 RepID=A0AAN6NG54_9PEZI|nr:Spc98 family-domain-containing protein [Diplogelasinospora grovesii]